MPTDSLHQAKANTDKMAGQRIYVTMYPCNECAKLIIQAGLREVIYSEGKDLGLIVASKAFLT